MKKASKNVGMYIILIVLVVSLVNVFLTPDGNKAGQTVEVLPYSQFLNEVDLGNVTKVKIDREQLKGTLKSGKEFTTYILDPGTLPSEISKKGVEVEVVPPKNSWDGAPDIAAADAAAYRRMDLFHIQHAGRRQQGDGLCEEQGKAFHGQQAQSHFR